MKYKAIYKVKNICFKISYFKKDNNLRQMSNKPCMVPRRYGLKKHTLFDPF